MEYGTAPSVITARSAMWNSGRLESMSATVSPRRTPSFARPPGEGVDALAQLRPRQGDRVVLRAHGDAVAVVLDGEPERLDHRASADGAAGRGRASGRRSLRR